MYGKTISVKHTHGVKPSVLSVRLRIVNGCSTGRLGVDGVRI